MRNNVIIVVGMHRSGTSLTTQWLKTCGLNIGFDLLSANDFNKDGYFEDQDFINLHERIFSNHNIPYGGFENIENFYPSYQEEQNIQKLINLKNRQCNTWGFKDPRTCLFLDSYHKIIPSAKFIVVLRDYALVLNSLVRRDVIGVKNSIKNSDRNVRLRLLKYHLFGKKRLAIRQRKKYRHAIKIYYQRIYSFLSTLDKSKYICFNVEDLQHLDNEIVNEINNWGFNLKKVDVNKIFKPAYLSTGQRNYTDDEIHHLQVKIKSLN